jgi:hypothetical protein
LSKNDLAAVLEACDIGALNSFAQVETSFCHSRYKILCVGGNPGLEDIRIKFLDARLRGHDVFVDSMSAPKAVNVKYLGR